MLVVLDEDRAVARAGAHRPALDRDVIGEIEGGELGPHRLREVGPLVRQVRLGAPVRRLEDQERPAAADDAAVDGEAGVGVGQLALLLEALALGAVHADVEAVAPVLEDLFAFGRLALEGRVVEEGDGGAAGRPPLVAGPEAVRERPDAGFHETGGVLPPRLLELLFGGHAQLSFASSPRTPGGGG